MPRLMRREPLSTMISRGWDPVPSLRELMRFEPFEAFLPEASTGFVPRFDIRERGDAYVIDADLPGVMEEDLDVTCTGNQLTISGSRREKQEPGETYRLGERGHGSFTRSFTLPPGVRLDQVVADLENGVLTVTVPKGEGEQARKIRIEHGEQSQAAE